MKILFIDRDGVLNQDKGYTYKTSDLKILDGVVDGLKEFQDMGYSIIIITNQSGIARGFFSLLDFHNFMNYLIKEFQTNGIKILDYFCPHHIDGKIKKYTMACTCRKPQPGMIIKAIKKYSLDASKSILVGDKESDILSGINSKIPINILITNKNPQDHSRASAFAKNLIEAANIAKELA